ncbi:uroporphyrinogen decarboxylase [Geothermobacter hydrogeniphilus]|uniref:Uroporphyrinogen decarboxylase n=1 Tax=Geothermobacter hydrogeniphilus TaxID=1969733 RepID=A0A1X0Y3Z3_9BACT|nr:uroporphyrinogen decarboxylase [Geothermobacter hydrogeniphilus]ORJ59876.1 uroporphyrinogen decarboxylase [Geothermobacter hydrogeniphilus]PNU21426.1 uroporphyrinogen decarboxylase [Geothermobacter hydrogeniphilus]
MSQDYTFLKACRGEKTDYTPVWMMRQAGRFLPQYREVRSKVSFLELCKTPELAAEVTIQPIDYLDADAAILFSDILTPVEPMGMKLDFVPGPVFENPVRTQADIDALRIPEMQQDVPYVYETIRILRRAFEGRVPLIGFGGAPFTLACYMVEGKGSKDFAQIKRMMYGAPELYAQLMEKVTEMDRLYLNEQVAAGAQAIQIFDTWGGIVSPLDYEKYVLPYTRKLIEGLDKSVPIIHFVKGSGTMLDKVRLAGSDVVGLDWHVNLGAARDILGTDIAVQGNLDPTVLYAPKEHIRREVQRILDENGGRPGHIFNLGHGILPTVDPEHAKYMVECVHELSGK